MKLSILLLAGMLFFPAIANAAVETESPQPEVMHAYSYATSANQKNGAVFLTIKFSNKVMDKGDYLLAVTSDVAETIELHTHIMENDVMKMRKVEDGFPVKDGAIEMQPSGDHIMLMGLKAPLEKGMDIDLKLHFKNSKDIDVSVPVLGAGEKPEGLQSNKADAHDNHHDHNENKDEHEPDHSHH